MTQQVAGSRCLAGEASLHSWPAVCGCIQSGKSHSSHHNCQSIWWRADEKCNVQRNSVIGLINEQLFLQHHPSKGRILTQSVRVLWPIFDADLEDDVASRFWLSFRLFYLEQLDFSLDCEKTVEWIVDYVLCAKSRRFFKLLHTALKNCFICHQCAFITRQSKSDSK